MGTPPGGAAPAANETAANVAAAAAALVSNSASLSEFSPSSKCRSLDQCATISSAAMRNTVSVLSF